MVATGSEAGHSLFISDLHLCQSRPAITRQFTRFLQAMASQADALYILGDLFEYWAGDDDMQEPHHKTVIASLHQLASSGVDCFLMHGNRDFLLGQAFARAAGMQILSDPSKLHRYGWHILLSHGDALCTDDVAYQAFRAQVRTPAWQQSFLATPLAARKAQIEVLRRRSEQEKSGKPEAIMDVNDEAVATLLRAYDYPDMLIHGHTHRPALHRLQIDSHAVERWVLGDWYEQGSCLRLNSSGCQVLQLDVLC